MPAPQPPTPDTTTAVNEVKRILPEGWAVTRVTDRTMPDGWKSESAVGLRIDGAKGADVFSIWLLPRDWIGIRAPSAAAHRGNYWAGILAGETRTTITVSTEETIPERLRALNLSTPSIVNSGWQADEKIWRGRFELAEATAERLVRAHCHAPADHDEAARSLVELGVPAASVFRRAALAGSEADRSFTVGALGYLPSPATISVLATVLRDPATPDDVRGSAAFAARTLAATELGAPLLDALALAPEMNARSHIIQALARVRHVPAGPAVHAAMRSTDNPHYKASFAEVLAVLRYRAAEGDIRALAEGPFLPGSGRFSKDAEADIRQKARLALLRLVGDWGASKGGLSLLLVAPKEATVGGAIDASFYIEHESDDAAVHGVAFGGAFVIEGLGAKPNMEPDGIFTTDPSVMWKGTRDLGEWLRAPGTYRVRYEAGGASSNTVTVVVKKR
jgi:hypothetical protein